MLQSLTNVGSANLREIRNVDIMQALKNGSRIGDYHILRLIAKGGMGEVYEAHDLTLDRRVALKIITVDSDSDDVVLRFMQEARTLAKINHPNIVTVYSIKSASDLQYIAMEFVHGISLKEFLHECRFDPAIATSLFAQVLEGVRVLHENGIIHRDLKPSNILIRDDGQIKILDFGIAKAAGVRGNTNPGTKLGTPYYMAPELLDGQPATARSDIWSLGAVLFECLTGKFMVTNLQDGELKLSKNDLALIPDNLHYIIGAMTATEPTGRYRSAGEVINDLRRLERPPTPEVFASFREQLRILIDELHPETPTGGVRPDLLPTPVSVPNFQLPPSSSSQNSSDGVRIVPAHSTTARRRARRRNPVPGSFVAGVAALLALAVGAKILKNKFDFFPVPAPSESARASEVQLFSPPHGQYFRLEKGKGVPLFWSAETDPSRFRIQVARDSQFQQMVIDEPASGSSFLAKNLTDGSYYWRLHASAGGTDTSAWAFTLATFEPPALSPLPVAKSKPSPVPVVTLVRPPAPPVQPVAQVTPHSTPAPIAKPIEKPVSAPPAADVHSRIPAAKSELGDLGVPVPLMPPAGASAPSRNGRASIGFSWESVPSATSYQLEVSSDAKFGNVIQQVETSELQTVLEQVELSGRFYWRVQARRAKESSKWSKPRSFVVH